MSLLCPWFHSQTRHHSSHLVSKYQDGVGENTEIDAEQLANKCKHSQEHSISIRLLTRSERHFEFLRLYLCDLLRLEFYVPILVANGDIFVLGNFSAAAGVLNIFAVFLLQVGHIITASWFGLALWEELLQKEEKTIRELLQMTFPPQTGIIFFKLLVFSFWVVLWKENHAAAIT